MALPIEYSNAIAEINQKLLIQPPPILAEIRECFQKIANKFTMLPEHWIEWARLELSRHRFHDFDLTQLNFHLKNIQSQALSCFYQKDLFLITDKQFENYHSKFIGEYLDRLNDDFFCYASSTGRLENFLSFPHKK